MSFWQWRSSKNIKPCLSVILSCHSHLKWGDTCITNFATFLFVSSVWWQRCSVKIAYNSIQWKNTQTYSCKNALHVPECKNHCVLIQIPIKFVPKGPVKSKPVPAKVLSQHLFSIMSFITWANKQDLLWCLIASLGQSEFSTDIVNSWFRELTH